MRTRKLRPRGAAAFHRNLFVPNKREYIKGRLRPKVDCIFCAILQGNPKVDQLLIWKDDLWAVSANLYPYNAGHLLLFPLRHILDLRQMTPEEALGLHRLTTRCLGILDQTYEPCGYNVGFNLGDASGASIEHLHQHIVPRYPKELGFVDIVSGAKIIIEEPGQTMSRLREAFAREG
jgi:ATP adenylyltransferase